MRCSENQTDGVGSIVPIPLMTPSLIYDPVETGLLESEA